MTACEQDSSFDAIFQENWTRVCAVIFRVVGDWAEAEDLALDVFLLLYRRPPRDRSNLTGWLYRVATNQALNALRSRKRREYYESQAGVQALGSDPVDEPLAEVERMQERQRVREALARLKPRSAQLIILRQMEMSYAEIAQALEIAPGSVGTLLARAEREFEQSYLSK